MIKEIGKKNKNDFISLLNITLDEYDNDNRDGRTQRTT
jgi:hypothetical protein